MKGYCFVVMGCIVLVAAGALRSAEPGSPPVAPVRVVTDNYFGIKVDDPYRWLENLDDPQVQTWLRAQADFTRTQLDRLPGRPGLLQDIKKYVNAVPATVRELHRTFGGRYFYLKTLSGQSLAKLYMRQGIDGKEALLVDTDQFVGPKGEPAAINSYSPSGDGKLVAYTVSVGGAEIGSVRIRDVDSGKDSGEVIDRIWDGAIAWRPDDRSFFYNRMQKLAPDASPLELEQKSKVYLHIVGHSADEDVAVLGIGESADVKIAAADFPFVAVQPGSDYAVGVIEHGVENENTLYAAPAAAVGTAGAHWTKICDTDAGVTDFTIHGGDIYLLTHKDSPRFKVVQTSLAHPDVAAAPTLLPQEQGVLRGLTATADALYATVLDGGVSHIIRVPYGGSAAQLKLPVDGDVDLFPSDARLSGIVFSLTSWTQAQSIFEFDPQSNQVNATELQPIGPYDRPDDLTSLEVKVPSYDGTEVPLSIVFKKGMKLDGTNPTILYAYGAYGITMDAGFGPSYLAWYERGGVFAVAHVRGGGEYGEQWHKAGYKLTKPNTWRDVIACAQYLIDQKYSSPAHLGVEGGSAGGITVGRTITERPDLFAAAVPEVGVMNPLRAETYPNGIPNVPEFGSVKTQEGFEDLFAMDSYQHVRDGVAYPAVMLTAGIHDPRVTPWMPAKMAARLAAATSSGKPILLRVEYAGGHGIGASRLQREEEYSDVYSFLLWRFGDAGFQPLLQGMKDALTPDATNTHSSGAITHLPVTLTSGFETDPRDRGRPVVLIAAALKVPPEVFRKAFSGVKPAGPGEQPQPDQVRRNKEALMAVLSPYGITNDRLDEVSNYYRYSRSRGEMWRNVPATATATIRDGIVTGFEITNAGSGYSSPPEISIPGMPEIKARVTLNFSDDFTKNGSIQKIELIAPDAAQGQ